MRNLHFDSQGRALAGDFDARLDAPGVNRLVWRHRELQNDDPDCRDGRASDRQQRRKDIDVPLAHGFAAAEQSGLVK